MVSLQRKPLPIPYPIRSDDGSGSKPVGKINNINMMLHESFASKSGVKKASTDAS
jgi:hypothetical protein